MTHEQPFYYLFIYLFFYEGELQFATHNTPKGLNNLWVLECSLQTDTRTLILKFDCWFIYVYFEVQIKFKHIIKLDYTFKFDLFLLLNKLVLVHELFGLLYFSTRFYLLMTKFSFSINLVT